jgi:spore coat polysaccharide biosynthesis protein SpsF (cytidylyltransferase family)
MKAIGLVAVRVKSSRLKRKALLDLNGKPLILHLLLRLKKSKKLDDVILCTSTHPNDRVLLEIAKENGFKSFAGSEDDVMDRFIYAGEEENADIIVRITGDNPLTDPEIIDQMIKSHINSNADYTRMDGLPIGITAEVIAFKALKKAFQLAEDSRHSEYMTYYFTEYPEIFKLNILQAPENINRPHYRLTVDYSEDYELLQKIFNHFNQSDFLIDDVVEFLDRNPKIAQINSAIAPIKVGLSINTRLRIGQ